MAAPTASNPVWLKLVKNGSTYTGYYSLNGSAWTLVGSTSVTFSNATCLAGLWVSSHVAGVLSTASFDSVSLSPSLPVGWIDADIGSPAVAGSAAFLPSTTGGGAGGEGSGVFTVSGGGADIYYASDQFNLVSQTVSGDQTLVARVTSLGNVNWWAKAGVMFRDILPSTSGGGAGGEGSAMFVDVVGTPGNGVAMQWRDAGGNCGNAQVGGVAIPSSSQPVWVKLVESGGLYTGYYSLDGATWTEVGSVSMTFTNTSYLAGLAVTSHDNSTLTTATFDNVSLSASVSDNLALNAPVTVSSTDSAGDVGANAVDGNPATSWTSASGNGTEWIQVDLGSTCAIDEVQLNWGAAYASAYQIQVSSDGVSWTTLYGTTTGGGGVQDLTGLSGSGRYIRLTATAGPQADYTLNEFAVYPVTLTWAGGNGVWGPEAADWLGPNGQLQTYQNGADTIFGPLVVPPSGGDSSNVISIFGQVSPHSITFASGGYVLQAGADPLGDQIVVPAAGTAINLPSPSGGGAGGEGTTDTINAVISGPGSLTETGGGTLVLSAANSMAGATVVSGTLQVGNVDALGGPASTTTVDAGATVSIWISQWGTWTVPGNFVLNGGKIFSNDGYNTLSGNIALNATSTIDVQWNNKSLALAGVISGPGGLTVTGAGTVLLGAGDLYRPGGRCRDPTARSGQRPAGHGGRADRRSHPRSGPLGPQRAQPDAGGAV